MTGVNKVVLVGHLGHDPSSRKTSGSDPVVTFSLATSESWRDKATGERRDRTEWHNVVIFNDGLCEVAAKYLKKGSKCYVEGKLRTREYEGRDGKRRTTEVVLERFRGELVLLDSQSNRPPPVDDMESYGTTRAREPAGAGAGTAGVGSAGVLDDDIPF